MVARLTITQVQYEEAITRFKLNDPFDPVLLDDRAMNGEITTIVKYDEQSILLQKIVGGHYLGHKVIDNADFFSGKYIANHVDKF